MGKLYIISTPIGNLEDITIRAIKTLFSVDYIACEDTRKTGILLSKLKMNYTSILNRIEVKKNIKLISYYDEIEEVKSTEIMCLISEGYSIALVSNAGTPLIADPGYKLVKKCLEKNIKVISIPGPSAVISSLVLSGFPPNQFLFLGYLPKSKNKRIKLLKSIYRLFDTSIKIRPTIIFFETPHRLKKSLYDLEEIFGDIEIVIARELTKIYEEVKRFKISQAQKYFHNPKGEVVLIFRI